jgi:hypothetical protein
MYFLGSDQVSQSPGNSVKLQIGPGATLPVLCSLKAAQPEACQAHGRGWLINVLVLAVQIV